MAAGNRNGVKPQRYGVNYPIWTIAAAKKAAKQCAARVGEWVYHAQCNAAHTKAAAKTKGIFFTYISDNISYLYIDLISYECLFFSAQPHQMQMKN